MIWYWIASETRPTPALTVAAKPVVSYPTSFADVRLRGRASYSINDFIPVKTSAPTPPVQQLAGSGSHFLANFSEDGMSPLFWRSKSSGIENHYGGRWSPDNVEVTPAGLDFSVRHDDKPNSPFSLSEIRTKEHLGYGRYEAVMQIGKGSGLVSAFFTYTGPYEGRPHDEIDIEFVGRDTRKIEFNYWRNGKTGAHAILDLPFDASEAPHLYAFEWLPDRITWYVDGEPFYSTPAGDTKIPTHTGRMYFSHWTGIPAMEVWHGAPTFESGEATTVGCASFTPVGEDTPSCSDVFKPSKSKPAPALTPLMLSP